MIEAVLGAVYERCYDDEGNEHAWVKYWPVPVTKSILSPPQVQAVTALGYFAGCRDWTRGRHWDRRSRYGER